MTKVLQSDHIHLRHVHKNSSLHFKTFPPDRRHDSLVSVNPHWARSGQPSSACTSMEHCISQDSKFQLNQQHGEYSSPDDITFCSNVAASSEHCVKAGTLETLPETQPLVDLKFVPKKTREEIKRKNPVPRLEIPEGNDQTVGTDPTSIESPVGKKSSAATDEEEGESSTGLIQGVISKEVQDKNIVTSSNFSKAADYMVVKNDAFQDVEDDEISETNMDSELLLLPKDEGSASDSSEVPTVVKSSSGSKETPSINLLRLKVSNARISSRAFAEKLEDAGYKNIDRSQGVGSGIRRRISSPGTASRTAFSGVQYFGNQVNHGSLQSEGGVVYGLSGTAKSFRTMSNYIRGQVVKTRFSKTLPSKWDDAEKWLVNASSLDSPSHPQSRNSSTTSSAGYTKASHGVAVGKRSEAHGRPLPLHGVSKLTECLIPDSEGYGGMALLSNHFQAILNESELPNAQEYSVLVRNNNQKYKQHVRGGKTPRIEAEMPDSMSKAGFPNQKPVTNQGAGTATKAICYQNDAKDLGGPVRGRVRDVQTIISTAIWSSSSNGVEQGLETGVPAEAFTQDKYADTVVETSKYVSSPAANDEDVQTPRFGRSSSMKDASTEISPAVSRRDMATQITPLGSSRTSRCTTPIKNNSPARHNTPTRRSASCSNTAVSVRELESCHLANLELGDLPAGTQMQSLDKVPSKRSPKQEEGEGGSSKCSQPALIDTKESVLEARAAAWEEAERAKHSAKYKREEAKIEAWENQQKAKAEAELKKLEVKLEKLRSQGTEKIRHRLAAALNQAEEMRAAAQGEQAEQVARAAERAAQLRKYGHFQASATIFNACFPRLVSS